MVIGEYSDTFDIPLYRDYWSSTEGEVFEAGSAFEGSIQMQTMRKNTPSEYDDRKYYIGSNFTKGSHFVRAVRSF